MKTGSIILTTGISGCGKSTWVKEFYPAPAVVLCPDEFRMALTGQWFFKPAEEAVWSAVRLSARVLAGFRKHDVVIDATNLTKGGRASWISLATEINASIGCVFFDVPVDICKQRNANRERKVPEYVIDKQAESLIAPSVDEGFYWVRNDILLPK